VGKWRVETMRIAGLIAVAMSALMGWAAPAAAGDTAEVNVLGFTPDGRVFAFEEYGVQDGSGFAYAHRFYIDTASDKFVAGTPIRVMLEDEGQSVQAARAQARSRGEKLFRDALLDRNRGNLVAFNAVTEHSADPHRIAASPRPVFPPIDPVLEFRLDEFGVTPPERCDGLGDIAGFRLLRIDSTPNGRTRLLHEDQKIPLSRGCPDGYRLGGVQTFFPESGSPVYAILIAIRRYGFEGPDFRWIAATGRL
jgi:predicted secreted protein